MRIAACLAAALCIAMPLAGQEEMIEWSPERKLRRDDFRGRPPINAGSASLSWLSIDASWECDGGALQASVRAMFDPSRSWWRTGGANIWGSAADRRSAAGAQATARRNLMAGDAQLLEHEQIHFDIAEITGRRIRSRIAEFTDACDEPGGIEPIRDVVAEADRELQDTQARYDRETGHGTDPRQQARWTQRVRALLSDPAPRPDLP